MEKIKVKILGLSFAHRKGMNTAWLVLYALEAAKQFSRRISEIAEVETEFIDLADKEIKPCLAYCEERHMPNDGRPYTGERPRPRGCPVKDDVAELIPSKVRGADGFIFGSPVHALGFTSKFRLFFERFSELLWDGSMTNKPAVAIAVGAQPMGGQETCLDDMNRVIKGGEMVCVSWFMGAPGISGPPYGPMIGDKDYNKRIGVKNDRYAKWLALLNGRRVAEFAILLKLAKQTLGELYTREFIQIYHPPVGDETWAWRHLDEEVEKYMSSLERPIK